MKNIPEFDRFAEASNIPANLIRAVIRQVGGWESFTERAEDVVKHGASCGFGGFIYYADTCCFYAVNRKVLVDMAADLAKEMDCTLVGMVMGFNCLDATEMEVGETLFGGQSKHDTQVANALAWFALEEVSRSYVDWKGKQNEG